jgi:hypothetical protein
MNAKKARCIMAEAQKIICPNCKTEISVDDVLHAQIEARVREKYEADKRKNDEALAAKEAELTKRAEEIEAAKKNTEKLVADAVAKEKADLLKKTEEAETAKRNADIAVANADIAVANAVKEQVAKREQEIQKQAKQDAESEQKVLLDALQNQLTEKTNKLTEALKEQAQLMDEKQKLKDEKEAFEIEKRRQLDAERDKIKEEADKKAAAAYQTILAQKEKTLADTLRLNEDLKRKIEQGSQQSQGEVAELNLEEELGKAFIHDEIVPVPKGIRGADIIQKVHNSEGKDCGQIIWEVKNTKSWSEGWIQKLKDDQREVRADVAIIISSVLPKDVKTFATRDGVWVCDINLAIPLATLVRDKLEAITREKGLAVGKNEKMDILYRYLTGLQFCQHIEAIVEAFSSMRQNIEKERKYFTKKWASQEMQIKKILTNTIGFYGDIDGILCLPKIQALELEYNGGDGAAAQESC